MKKRIFDWIYFGLIVFYFPSSSLVAQEYFSLNVDNDLYFETDHYYSSGIFLQYGKQIETQDTLKKYILWELGQEIYTPDSRYTSNSTTFDYPYGGWTSLKLTFQKERSKKKQTQWGIQIGVTGDASGAQWMQNNYHRLVLRLPELPWTDQVSQAFHLNAFLDSFNRWKLNEELSLQTHLFTTAGTQKIMGGAAAGFVTVSYTHLTLPTKA